jgi:hypothetical protein
MKNVKLNFFRIKFMMREIPAEQAIEFFSYRMQSPKVMGN